MKLSNQNAMLDMSAINDLIRLSVISNKEHLIIKIQ